MLRGETLHQPGPFRRAGNTIILGVAGTAILLAACGEEDGPNRPEDTGVGVAAASPADPQEAEPALPSDADKAHEEASSSESLTAAEIADSIGAREYDLYFRAEDGSGLLEDMRAETIERSREFFREGVEDFLTSGDSGRMDYIVDIAGYYSWDELRTLDYINEQGQVHEGTLDLFYADFEAGDTPFHLEANDIYDTAVGALTGNAGDDLVEVGFAKLDNDEATGIIVFGEGSEITASNLCDSENPGSNFAAVVNHDESYALFGGYPEVMNGLATNLGLEPRVVDCSSGQFIDFNAQTTAGLQQSPALSISAFGPEGSTDSLSLDNNVETSSAADPTGVEAQDEAIEASADISPGDEELCTNPPADAEFEMDAMGQHILYRDGEPVANCGGV